MMDGRGSWIWIWPQVVPKSMQLKNRTCLNLHVQKCSWYFFGDQVWCWTESVKLFEMKKCDKNLQQPILGGRKSAETSHF